MFDYPQTGLHFSVFFEILPQFPNDIRFQSVSGLTVSSEFESLSEGGENRFSHQLPVRLNYGDITLKRGKGLGSGVLFWARQALENFDYKPVNVMISLLNAEHLPLFNWYVINAIPKRLEVSGIDAMNAEVVIETLVLSYQYFKYYDPVSVTLDATAALTSSVNINI